MPALDLAKYLSYLQKWRCNVAKVMVNMHQAKTELSKLVARALAGEEVIVTRNGKPVVRLVPISRRRTPGGLEGKIWISPEFYEPLPEEVLREFEGR